MSALLEIYSGPVSHWSSSYITALSLVESYTVMLRRLSYAIKNQLKAPNAIYLGHFSPFDIRVASMHGKDLL